MCAFATMSRCSIAARYEARKNGRLALPQSCTVSQAVRTLRTDMQSISDTRQPCPGALMRLPCDAADGHTNNVSEGFPLLACLRAR